MTKYEDAYYSAEWSTYEIEQTGEKGKTFKMHWLGDFPCFFLIAHVLQMAGSEAAIPFGRRLSKILVESLSVLLGTLQILNI